MPSSISPFPPPLGRAEGYFPVNPQGWAWQNLEGRDVDLKLKFDLEVQGDTTLGNSSSDSLTFNIGTWTIGNNYTQTRALGAVSGTQQARQELTTASASNTNLDVRGSQDQLTFTGSTGATNLTVINPQLEVQHDTGTLTFARGVFGYGRLGLSGSTVGAVTSFRVLDFHLAHEGVTGAITNGEVLHIGDVDLASGSGNITNMRGVRTGDLGHATRVTAEAIAFDGGNMTGGAPITAIFRGQMASGTGKWNIYVSGTADNSIKGKVRIGDNTAPTDQFEATGGYSKLTHDGSVITTGNYHEIRSANNDFIMRVSNLHATAPHGLGVDFTGAAPDDNTQIFIRCRDSGTNRMLVYSDGDLQNHDNSYAGISDERLKQDITDANEQWDDFKRYRFRNYRFKSDVAAGKDHRQIGLIAQELREVSPGLVIEDGEGMLGVQYSVLAVKTAKLAQELIERVEELERKLAAGGN